MIPTLIVITLALILTAASHAKQPLTVRLSQTIVQVWTCETQRGLPRTPAPSPWKPHSEGWRRAQLNAWTLKRKACLAALHETARQWNWQAWLPSHGRRLAICETSMDWKFTGHSSDGHFVSAFAISVNEYDRDAARMGVRGWWAKKTPPSPWEQWQAAIGHYKLHGDGWTGHCHGIMR